VTGDPTWCTYTQDLSHPGFIAQRVCTNHTHSLVSLHVGKRHDKKYIVEVDQEVGPGADCTVQLYFANITVLYALEPRTHYCKLPMSMCATSFCLSSAQHTVEFVISARQRARHCSVEEDTGCDRSRNWQPVRGQNSDSGV